MNIITGKEPITPHQKHGYSLEQGPTVTDYNGLTIVQYFMAHAKPPKVIFEPVISSFLRAGNSFIPPAYNSDEYKFMLSKLAKADADYRFAFAQAMIEKLNNRTEQ